MSTNCIYRITLICCTNFRLCKNLSWSAEGQPIQCWCRIERPWRAVKTNACPLTGPVHIAPICWWVALILWSVPWNMPSKQQKNPPWKRTTTVKATEPSLCLCSSLWIEVLAMNAHSRMEGSCGYSLDLVVTSLIHLALYLYSEIQSQIHPFKSLGTLPHIRQTVMAARCWISTATGGQYRYPSQGVRGEKSFLKVSRWNYSWTSFLSFTWSSPPCFFHMFSKLSA